MNWRRFYDFVIFAHARGRDAFAPDDVRTLLLEEGLTSSPADVARRGPSPKAFSAVAGSDATWAAIVGLDQTRFRSTRQIQKHSLWNRSTGGSARASL
jgi:hypothetical protein